MGSRFTLRIRRSAPLFKCKSRDNATFFLFREVLECGRGEGWAMGLGFTSYALHLVSHTYIQQLFSLPPYKYISPICIENR